MSYIIDSDSDTHPKESLLSQQEINQNNISDKKFINRYFGPMHKGSLRGSIFALLASAMGTGLFNLPQRTREIGVIPFALFILLGALFSMIGMVLIVRLILQYKFKSYGQMSEKAYGTPLKRISEVFIIVYPWGITICFQVIFASFICQLLSDELGISIYEQRSQQIFNDNGNLIRILINLGCLALTSILALKKDVSILQKIAIIGVISVIFNITVVIIICMIGFNDYPSIIHVNHQKISWFGQKQEGNLESISLLAQGMASILFCYVNHQMIFPLSMSLKRPNSQRFSKIINRVHIVEFIAYTSIGIMAYLLLLENIQKHGNKIAPIVLASIPILIVSIGKILMLAALFLAVPLNMFPARQSFFDATKIQRSNKNNIIVTMALMCSSTLIAIVFRKVNSYFGLLGGTAGVMMAGGIPAICYFKLRGKLSAFDIILLILCFLITIFASAGAILSIVDPPKS